MPRIRIYTTRWCGYCVRAKALLEQRGIPYEEVSLDDDPNFRQTVFDLTGRWTVPQILIDDEPIGGYVELWRLDQSDGLEKLAALPHREGRPHRHQPGDAQDVGVPHPDAAVRDAAGNESRLVRAVDADETAAGPVGQHG
jgi:glutaredoxin 3